MKCILRFFVIFLVTIQCGCVVDEDFSALWLIYGDELCKSNTTCIHGQVSGVAIPGQNGSGIIAGCECKCDPGYCGKRCNFNTDLCSGNSRTFLDSDGDCRCECNDFRLYPPDCTARHVSFFNLKEGNHQSDSVDYFPLQLGNEWIFNVVDTSNTRDQQFGMRISDKIYFEGQLMFGFDLILGDTISGMVNDSSLVFAGPVYYTSPDDSSQVIRLIAKDSTENFVRHTYSDGDTIMSQGNLAYVSFIDTFSVPAGVFDSCFIVADTSGSGLVFAPDIGWIAYIVEDSATMVLSEYNLSCNINATLNYTSISCNSSNDGQLEFNVDVNADDFSFEWDGPVDIPDTSLVTNLSSGIYSLTVTGRGCRAVIDSIILEDPKAISIQIDSIIHTECMSENGSINIEVSGGRGSLSYEWNGGLYTTEDINGLSTGCYELIVTDSLGCSSSAIFEILMTDQIEVEATVNEPDCYQNQNASIELMVSGGNPPYTYVWNTGETDANLNDISAGSYSVTVTDGNGCEAVLDTSIQEPAELIVEAESLQDPDCEGQSNGSIDVIISGGIPPYSFNWNSGSYNSEDLVDISAGNYHLIVSDSNLCTEEIILEVNEPDILEIKIDTVKEPDCVGDSNGIIDVKVNGGTPPYSYNWNNGAFNTEDLSGIPKGEYHLEVTDANMCTSEFYLTLKDPNLFEIVGIAEDVSCFGAQDGRIDIAIFNGTFPFTVEWNGEAGGVSIDSLGAGIYQAIVVDAKGCETSAEFEISQPEILEIKIDTVKEPDCVGDSNGIIDVKVNGGIPPYSYNWNNGAFNTEDLSGIPKGEYHLEVTDANMCTSEFYLTLKDPNLFEIVGIAEDVSCFGAQDGRIDIAIFNGTYPFTVEWNGEAGGVSIDSLGADTYQAIVVDAKGCKTSAEFEISQPDELMASFTITNATGNEANGSASVNVTGGTPGYTYLWDDPAGHTSSEVQGLAAGMYTVTITDSNGCELIETVEIGMTTSVSENADMSFEYFPNPVTEYLYLKTRVKKGFDQKVFLYGISTNLTLNYTPEKLSADLYRIDMSEVPDGVYYLILENNHAIKIIKLK